MPTLFIADPQNVHHDRHKFSEIYEQLLTSYPLQMKLPQFAIDTVIADIQKLDESSRYPRTSVLREVLERFHKPTEFNLGKGVIPVQNILSLVWIAANDPIDSEGSPTISLIDDKKAAILDTLYECKAVSSLGIFGRLLTALTFMHPVVTAVQQEETPAQSPQRS